MKYRKKPVVIDAFWYYDGCEYPDWFKEAREKGIVTRTGGSAMFPASVKIKTLEGELVVDDYTYVIKGVKDEIYPCRKDIFEMTYEEVDE